MSTATVAAREAPCPRLAVNSAFKEHAGDDWAAGDDGDGGNVADERRLVDDCG